MKTIAIALLIVTGLGMVGCSKSDDEGMVPPPKGAQMAHVKKAGAPGGGGAPAQNAPSAE